MNIKTTFHRKRILITGSTGNIATNLLQELKQADCTIIRLSRPGTQFPNIDGKAHVQNVTGDMREAALWNEVLEGVDVVFHLAAQTSYAGNAFPDDDLDMNCVPMLQLLETCRQREWCPAVLFAGTVTQTGLPDHLPVDETHPDRPISIYDLHKLMAEQYLEYFARQGYVRGATLRLANVYGPGPSASGAGRGTLNVMAQRGLLNQKLPIYGSGNYLRDFVYISDVVDAFLRAAKYIDQLNGHHYVIGSGQGHTFASTIRLLSERLAHVAERRAPTYHVEPPRPLLQIEQRNFVANSSRFAEITGWRSQVNLTEGIDRTIDYYLT
ncbi:MAG: NAD-dependent epimerase/dehydratase family protein, partial [Chloroflexota bacterium]